MAPLVPMIILNGRLHGQNRGYYTKEVSLVMTTVEDFVEHYKKEYDFYETVSRLVSQQLENLLQASGIRAIVTYRAKNPERLLTKLNQRDQEKHYSTLNDIYSDICDLSGVRVALYFPSDRDKVENLIKENFVLEEPKIFPDSKKSPSYTKRFSGYWARHYRITINDVNFNDNHKRYLNSKTEIQVASVLMHAWSEVEHDLVYKPLNGNLSDEEFSILDELNGLVLAGEIALERLHAAGDIRIKKENTFNNQYELASYLYNKFENKLASNTEIQLGNVELLFKLMYQCNIFSSTELAPYLKSLNFTKELRSISEQISDNILVGNNERYKIYTSLKMSHSDSDNDLHSSMGYFMEQWIVLERIISSITQDQNPRSRILFSSNNLKEIFSPKEYNRLLELRKIRNMLVHGIEIPSSNNLIEMANEIKEITNLILSSKSYSYLKEVI